MKYLYIFILAMLPILELRGALPVAAALGIPLSIAFPLAVLGNIVPLPFIYYFGLKILHLLEKISWTKRFAEFTLSRGKKAGEKLLKNSGYGLFVALWLFVSIPLPGTGAWTGMLAATLLQLKFKDSFWACACGVLTAAILLSFFIQFFV